MGYEAEYIFSHEENIGLQITQNIKSLNFALFPGHGRAAVGRMSI